MADLSDKDSAQSIKIIGADASGVEQTPVNSTVNGDLTVADGLNFGGVYGVLSLTTGGTSYEAKVGVSALANRKALVVTADDDMYWGLDSSVTTSTGTPLKKNQQITFNTNPNSPFSVWLVASGSSKTARIVETP